jgi:hypothetical protein
MKINCLYVALLLVLIGTACKNDTPNQTNAAAAATSDTLATEVATQAPALSGEAGAIAFPAEAQGQAAPNTAAAGSGKLNPAHGQPGHRCDISVGAPLDQAPAAKGAAAPDKQPTQITVPTPTTAAPAAAAAAPGMNPAHGQPGHRCDISVGAPLDSKPAAKQ